MAKGKILKILLWFLSLPIIIPSFLLEFFMTRKLRSDLEKCLTVIENNEIVPPIFTAALMSAEDHRSQLHCGIDPLAIVRSLIVKIKSGKWQGASTIEQQYVRVITSRYERTGLRKLREQMLAIMLARRASKESISSAYLTVAFYGTDFIGLKGLRLEFGEDLESVSFQEALRMMVQLKYPKPRKPNDEWHSKISSRLSVIKKRLRKNQCHLLDQSAASLKTKDLY